MGGKTMELTTNKMFGNLSMDIYVEGEEFYMTRRQINDALEYSDDKSIARIITRNKDVIGEGIKRELVFVEGDRPVTREVELFSFMQIFNILRFSKQPKANLFMSFTALTMKQLVTGKAELEFRSETDKNAYIKQVKDLMDSCKLYGIPKTRAALLIQEAKMTEGDPNIAILNTLREKEKLELKKKRDRITRRVEFMAQFITPTEEETNEFEAAWHALANALQYVTGRNMYAIRRRQEKAGKPKTSYLDFIAEDDAYDDAEKVINKILKEYGVK
jgi:hypothetical protein